MIVARYRLRFLLQEIDLRPGETLIGRSALCHVTIEDPLVSRQHARVFTEGDRVTLEDLDSRNGTFVNGKQVEGTRVLADGDRVRVGTLELVFCTAQDLAREARPGRRTTGFMCHCAHCGTPYPTEASACPSCGSETRVDDDTISGLIGEAQRDWTLEVLTEVLGKALVTRRWEEVERMLRRARATIESKLATGQAVGSEQLDYVGQAAVQLSVERGQPDWAGWALAVYATAGQVPAEEVLQPLDLMAESVRRELAGAASRLVTTIQAKGGPDSREVASYVRLRALRGAAD